MKSGDFEFVPGICWLHYVHFKIIFPKISFKVFLIQNSTPILLMQTIFNE